LRIIFRKYTLLLLFWGVVGLAKAQLTAIAGNDNNICPGTNTTLGGAPSATGGTAPYTYNWQPNTWLSSNTVANPVSSPQGTINYTLTVTDNNGNSKSDVVTIGLKSLSFLGAGLDTSICLYESATLGALYNYSNPDIIYAWSPASTLNDSTLPKPVASPLLTTTYSLVVTENGCPSKSEEVTLTIIPPPSIDAGNDTTILEGTTITLWGSGAYNWDWYPKSAMWYYYTATPNTQPLETTMYYALGTDPSGHCVNFDSVLVTVIPYSDVIIYNTFTPNGDGQNDTWYIANIYKYPENSVKVYNRYGKVVFQTSDYHSEWDGKSNGENLPAGTYFYDLDLGGEKGFRHGTVTIIR
jgi:gliding motility-associated-like protein